MNLRTKIDISFRRAGRAAIHKGLGPAHAVAIISGDQGLHHGLIVAIALPHTIALVAPHAAEKADRLAAATGRRRSTNSPTAWRAATSTGPAPMRPARTTTWQL